MTAPPPPVDQLDAAVAQAIRSVHRARWAVLLAVIIALVAAVGLLGWQDWQQRQELRASCGFFLPLTSLPVMAVPPAARPSKTGVTLIAGSRTAYAGEGCGALPPAAPSLVRWARYYRIRLP